MGARAPLTPQARRPRACPPPRVRGGRDTRGVALDEGAVALEREIRVEGEARLDLRARLAEPAQSHKAAGQEKQVPGKVTVRVDGLSQPLHRSEGTPCHARFSRTKQRVRVPGPRPSHSPLPQTKTPARLTCCRSRPRCTPVAAWNPRPRKQRRTARRVSRDPRKFVQSRTAMFRSLAAAMNAA